MTKDHLCYYFSIFFSNFPSIWQKKRTILSNNCVICQKLFFENLLASPFQSYKKANIHRNFSQKTTFVIIFQFSIRFLRYLTKETNHFVQQLWFLTKNLGSLFQSYKKTNIHRNFWQKTTFVIILQFSIEFFCDFC